MKSKRIDDFRIVKGKGPVVHLDRSKKAERIERIIELFLGKPIKNKRILDIGCGNGGICRQFNENNEVYGVDVEDLRKTKKGFTFKLVNSAELPFKDNLFDIVITNHTIEHIPEQKLHLQEVHRVLKKNGLVFLATPNKSSPFMQGHIGNPDVLRWKNMRKLFEDNGFIAHEQGSKILKSPRKYKSSVTQLSWMPNLVLKLLRPIYPSHIFILEPSSSRRKPKTSIQKARKK